MYLALIHKRRHDVHQLVVLRSPLLYLLQMQNSLAAEVACRDLT